MGIIIKTIWKSKPVLVFAIYLEFFCPLTSTAQRRIHLCLWGYILIKNDFIRQVLDHLSEGYSVYFKQSCSSSCSKMRQMFVEVLHRNLKILWVPLVSPSGSRYLTVHLPATPWRLRLDRNDMEQRTHSHTRTQERERDQTPGFSCSPSSSTNRRPLDWILNHCDDQRSLLEA